MLINAGMFCVLKMAALQKKRGKIGWVFGVIFEWVHAAEFAVYVQGVILVW